MLRGGHNSKFFHKYKPIARMSLVKINHCTIFDFGFPKVIRPTW
jgi:hypothetical protein